MQLQLPDAEIERLGRRVEQDFRDAISDHDRRMERFKAYYRKWRNRVDVPRAGEEDASNFSVPMVQWQTFGRLSKEMTRLLGDDAEIIAKPVGPSDAKVVAKIGRYMSWRLFDSMKITSPLSVFTFRKILFGRSHAYRPWIRETYRTSKGKKLWYEGPGFFPMWPDDLVVPAEDVDNIQQFSFVCRKVRLTPQQLLDGERAGRYFGIEDNFDEIVKAAGQWGERDSQGTDMVKEAKDESEGVTYEHGMSGKGRLLILEWYGRWRLPKGKKDPGEEFDLTDRKIDESELVVSVIQDMTYRPIGCQDLIKIYPHMKNRRPFAEASLVKDGSYWPAGFGELLESIEDEVTANHRLFTDAGRLSVGPVVFYRPGQGFNPKTFKYAPNTAIPTEDPAGVNALQMRSNMEFPIANGQQLRAYSELVSGESDTALGRSSDRPNAPRTASGTIALIDQGNIRADFDVMGLREDMREFLGDLWALDCDMAPKQQFFRVTEEQAGGLFDTGKGGATMTEEERAGRFDFDIEFATNTWSKEQKKQTYLQLYAALLQNPLVATNPQTLGVITKELCKRLGFDNIADVIPVPPELDRPKEADEEWTEMLQGEEVPVNPADNDELHLVQHKKQMATELDEDPEHRDFDAEMKLRKHMQLHVEQSRTKMMMQALTQHLVNTVAGNMASGGGGLVPGGVPLPLQQLHQTVGDLIGAAPGNGTAPQPGAPAPGNPLPGAPPNG